MAVGKDTPDHEAQLISRCKAGNKEEFYSLIAPYLQSIGMVAYSILQNRADAEEIVQETVLKAFTRLEQLRTDEHFKAWLLQIAANEARMRLRKHRIREFVSVEGEIQEREHQPRQFVESSNIPSAKLEQKELRDALIRGLNRLNESYRTVFVLRDIQHLSSVATAEILNVSQELVDIRLHRARLQMRKHVSSFFRRPTREWIPFSLRMMKLMGKTMLRRVISCRRAMKELSNYIDECVSDQLRKAIEEHLRQCDRCSAVLDATRKVLYIVGDDKVFDLPFRCTYNWDRLLNQTSSTVRPASSP